MAESPYDYLVPIVPEPPLDPTRTALVIDEAHRDAPRRMNGGLVRIKSTAELVARIGESAKAGTRAGP